MMDGTFFEACPQSVRFGDTSFQVCYLPVTDSTNLRLRAWRDGTPPEGMTGDLCYGTCLAAGMQTAGRGRLGRSFLSPESGLYFSLYLKAGDPEKTLEVTPAAACAVCAALERSGIEGVGIKWVNDLYYRGKKVCGILCERVGDGVICGIGINLTEPPGGFPPEAGPAGALDREDLGKDTLLLRVLEQMAFALKEENRDRTLEMYRSRLVLQGRRVRCAVGDREIRGRVLGIGEDFSLVLAVEDGRTCRLSTGEVTRVFREEETEERTLLRTAFFDFDGTLRPGDSIVSYLAYARRKGALSLRGLCRAGADAVLAKLGRIPLSEAKTRALSFERALSARDREALILGFVREELLPGMYPAGRREWARLGEEGYQRVLVSASTEEYMRPLARALGADALLCTPLDPEGKAGPNCRGREKAERMRQWERTLPRGIGVDWEGSLAFGDSRGDEAMLCLTGHPAAVNPSRALRRTAERRGWPCLEWNKTTRGNGKEHETE